MSTSSKLASFLEDGKQGGIKIVIKNAGPAIFFSFSAQLVRPQLLQQRSMQLWEHFAAFCRILQHFAALCSFLQYVQHPERSHAAHKHGLPAVASGATLLSGAVALSNYFENILLKFF